MKPLTLRAIARAYLISMTFWCGLAVLMGLQYSPPNREHFWSSLLNLLVQALLRGLALALWAPPIFYLVKKHLGSSTHRVRYVLFWGLGAVPFLLLATSILWVVVPPPYDDALHKVLPRSFHWWVDIIRTNFADQLFIYISVVVAGHGYEYLRRLRREERERYEYQQALATSELQALKMQLQPHFLFNTLNGIATLVDADPGRARAMIVKLSNLLRAVLDRDSTDLIPLEEELSFAREYLDLEKMRFGDRLEIEWLIAPEVRGILVPQMVLQPLVENAIRHGVASTRAGGWIEIGAGASDGVLNLHVRNSGGGQPSNGTGVGLRNIEARLKYLYAGDANLRLTVGEDRTATARVTLPALNSQPPASGGAASSEEGRDACSDRR